MKKLRLQGIVWFILLLAPLCATCQESSGPYTLPVRITSFSGSAKSWDLVVLNWVTEAEVVHKKFEIQRSLNGTDFNAIGSINSIDDFIGPKSYSYQDHDVATLNAKRLLYRIRQISADGSSGYSKILVVDREPSTLRMTVAVSPNPVVDQLRISLQYAATSPVGFRVLTIDGRETYRQWSRPSTNEYNMPAHNGGLNAPGIYFAQIFFEDGTSASIKFLKK
jgi:hypothetical protein